MELFNKIRSVFGVKTEITESPIEILSKAITEHSSLENQLEKAQQEYDESNTNFTLKIEACNKLIEKGVTEAISNKTILEKKLDTITNDYLNTVGELSKKVSESYDKKVELESDIIIKSVELTAALPEDDQKQINDIIVTWQETGLIKGEEVESQVLAINKALEIVLSIEDNIEKAGEGSKGGKIIGHTKSGKPIYAGQKVKYEDKSYIAHSNDKESKTIYLKNSDGKLAEDNKGDSLQVHESRLEHEEDNIKKSNEDELNERDERFIESLSDEQLQGIVEDEYEIIKAESDTLEGNYANVLVKKNGKLLFLKRADKKDIAPGQYCLPGGHIEKGETIQQAAVRELKEEANLTASLDSVYILGKAKCDDGKWAYYLSVPAVNDGELALLDGESSNACWMSQEEWMKADLFFDLKDHLKDLESGSDENIPEICKAEGSRGGKIIGHTKSGKPIYDYAKHESHESFTKQDHSDAIDAHKKIINSTKNEIIGHEKKKESKNEEIKKSEDSEIEKAEKNKKLKKDKTLSVGHLTAHAENTSSGTLKKAAKSHPQAHVKESAKRELERRASEKNKQDQKMQKVSEEQIKANEKRLEDITKRMDKIHDALRGKPEHKNHDSLLRELTALAKEYKKLKAETEKIDC